MKHSLWIILAMTSAAMINVDELWDYQDPEASEGRFRDALENASTTDRLILNTQIARTFSLRSEFGKAESLLREIEKSVKSADSAEVFCRFHLESGRTLVSGTRPASADEQDRTDRARSHYARAFEIAESNELDALAIDAVHMMAFVDSTPDAQLSWARQGLAIALQSTQPSAQNWEASLRNNIGYAHHQLGNYEDALVEFELAVTLREQLGSEWQIHVAHWMVAWTLRHLDRIDEATDIQHQLEAKRQAIGKPDAYVFEELAALYKVKGRMDESSRYTKMFEAQSNQAAP